MTTVYERFKDLKLDKAWLGLEPGDSRSDYSCTPVGAEVIGWEGVDGIHYCFIDGFGEMVFAVSPANLPGDHVHPLARSFEDFLRLVLACGGTAAAEQAHGWSREYFNAFLEEERGECPQERLTALEGLQEGLPLAPMDDPYGYIREIQSSFDYSKLKFKPEYDRLVPEEPKRHTRPAWKVYFDGNFGQSHAGRDRPGKEVTVNARFTWGKQVWHVPAVYLCSVGLVMDLCTEVDPADILAYRDKWNQWGELGWDRPRTPEQQDQMMEENPLTFYFSPQAEVNGRVLKRRSGSGFSWMPVSCLTPEERSTDCQLTWEAVWLMEHYGLNPELGWAFHRETFPWVTKGKPTLRTLKLRMAQDPRPVPGPRFAVYGPGEAVPFTHPTTGKEHTLHVVEYEQQKFSAEQLARMGDEEWEYPTCYSAMTYAISPDLPKGAVSLQDCGEGDRPRRKAPPNPMRPEGAASVGIIASSRGLTALTSVNGSEAQTRAACSSLRFQPAEKVEWRMVFYEKTLEDVEVDIAL